MATFEHTSNIFLLNLFSSSKPPGFIDKMEKTKTDEEKKGRRQYKRENLAFLLYNNA